MNFIKKIMATFALGMVLITPALAADCKIGTQQSAREQSAAIPDATVRALTKAEIAKIIDKKGPPPNATEGDLEMDLVTKGEIGGINVYQDGCFINRLGPTSTDNLNKLLDITES